jgi:recombinational DNA repair protein RecT
MAKKAVIGRACKMVINSSDDTWLYEGKADEDTDLPREARDESLEIESIDTDAIEVTEEAPAMETSPDSNEAEDVASAPAEELPFDETPDY